MLPRRDVKSQQASVFLIIISFLIYALITCLVQWAELLLVNTIYFNKKITHLSDRP